jgi:hypothetical protein
MLKSVWVKISHSNINGLRASKMAQINWNR